MLLKEGRKSADKTGSEFFLVITVDYGVNGWLYTLKKEDKIVLT